MHENFTSNIEIQLQSITNSARDPILMMDPRGKISFWNPAAEKVFGYTEKEALGRNLHELLAPERFHKSYAEAYKIFKGSGHGDAVGKTIELSALRKGGQEFPVELSLSAVLLNGEWHAVGILRDISERKRAEEALRFNETRLAIKLTLSQMTEAPLRQITDFALEGAVRLTKSDIGYLAFMNHDETVLTMHSWSKRAMTQCDIAEKPIIYAVEKTGLWGEAIRQRKHVITNDYGAENPLKRGLPEGHVPLKRHMNLPLLDGDKIVAVIGVGNKKEPYDESDVRQLTLLMQNMWMIVRRKRVETALREGEKRFRDLAEMLPEIVFETDKNLNLTYANHQAFDIFGYSPRELKTGLNLPGLIAQVDARRMQNGMLKRLKQELTSAEEYLAKRKDGSTFPVLLHASPILQKQNFIGMRGIIVDITERKHIQEQLLQSQKMKSIGTLAGGIAHDFNNLLQPILGYTDLLQEDLSDNATQLEYVNNIKKAGSRAKDLIKQILTFSRQTEHTPGMVRLHKLIGETYKLARSTIPSNINIQKNIQKNCPVVMGDSTQLQQVVMNLMINAYHAVEPSNGEIKVTLEEVVLTSDETAGLSIKPGRHARICVSDTGHGMDAGVIEKIFDPYFTTKPKGKGTGLGLSLVYGIVKHHRGDIKVESEPGKGSTFSIFLPVNEITPEKLQAQETEPHPTGCERILIVDDEEIVAELMGRILKRLGYQVTTYLSSVDALEAFRKHPESFDLLITDMTMPNMTGDELAKAVTGIRPELPIILCTGFSEKIEEEEASRKGINAVLMKPISMSEISKKVRAVLDN